MNCMKHRRKNEKGCSAAARKLIQEAFTELQADAIVNGWVQLLVIYIERLKLYMLTTI